MPFLWAIVDFTLAVGPTDLGRQVARDKREHARLRATRHELIRATRKLGIAGLSGSVYGETTPSASGVEVVGMARDDFALNVMLEHRQEQIWLAPDLVEFVDHAPGTEMTIGDRRFVRAATGQWDERRGDRQSVEGVSSIGYFAPSWVANFVIVSWVIGI